MIQLRVVTPYGNGFEEEVDRVIVRGSEGDLALMKSTAPIVTPLAIGKIQVISSEGKSKVGNINSGYVSMKNDVVTVVTDAFEWEENVDIARVQEAKKRAEERIAKAANDKNIDLKRAQLALARAKNRLEKLD